MENPRRIRRRSLFVSVSKPSIDHHLERGKKNSHQPLRDWPPFSDSLVADGSPRGSGDGEAAEAVAAQRHLQGHRGRHGGRRMGSCGGGGGSCERNQWMLPPPMSLHIPRWVPPSGKSETCVGPGGPVVDTYESWARGGGWSGSLPIPRPSLAKTRFAQKLRKRGISKNSGTRH